MNADKRWIERVIQMAVDNVERGEDPFAALVVRGDRVVGSGINCTHQSHDPSAHAELLAIREACRTLETPDLSDCELYASGEPCPMCMGAIYWAKLGAVYYACGKADAADGAGFGDPLHSFYADMAGPLEKRSIPMRKMDSDRKLEPFRVWKERQARADGEHT
ncbi:hypothetical protein J31TS4_03820 [Paenibacillus sp. J31TS4]|uniref:nucleoside deaminase n=1 Tax=Paenibacillus sp. J31TS4 TaxID=2807195 RepID=UPI001B24FFE4|nr:nucleoside deaminase [Paenibacillus sp. J31TS4]GIP37102.1 hypothetical protein J31TS4_03820 [Paenibacillus sp. J31TS4]